LEHVPKELTGFFDKDLLQLIDIEGFFPDHMIALCFEIEPDVEHGRAVGQPADRDEINGGSGWASLNKAVPRLTWFSVCSSLVLRQQLFGA
jgi:hypothetical protein